MKETQSFLMDSLITDEIRQLCAHHGAKIGEAVEFCIRTMVVRHPEELGEWFRKPGPKLHSTGAIRKIYYVLEDMCKNAVAGGQTWFTPRDIATRCNMRPGPIQDALDLLLEDGLVEKIALRDHRGATHDGWGREINTSWRIKIAKVAGPGKRLYPGPSAAEPLPPAPDPFDE